MNPNKTDQTTHEWVELEGRLADALAGKTETEAICRLLIAATQVKDERIAELEATCDRFCKQVARLARLTHPRPHRVARKTQQLSGG